MRSYIVILSPKCVISARECALARSSRRAQCLSPEVRGDETEETGAPPLVLPADDSNSYSWSSGEEVRSCRTHIFMFLKCAIFTKEYALAPSPCAQCLSPEARGDKRGERGISRSFGR